jgi:hypothetical protein
MRNQTINSGLGLEKPSLEKIKQAVQKKVDEANRHLASLPPSELEKITGRSKKTA